MLDSGSVSFLRSSSFKKIFDIPLDIQNNDKQLYKAFNNTPISTLASISTTIQLESLSNLTVSIDLHVLKNNFASADLIIGRDFLE